jgi:ACS family hexuronate transporter-like MFS transporter
MESSRADNSSGSLASSSVGYFRWIICALLLFGTTKNYMDRQVLGVLKTTLQQQFAWNEIDYSNLVVTFQVAYAGGMLLAGPIIDRPKKERALATGIFNAGTNFGAIITPLTVPWITYHWGWRAAFLFTGALGFVWLAAWLLLYRKPAEHPRLSAQELAYIQSDPPQLTGRIKWTKLLPYRQTWAFVAGKFLLDPVWWFYLFWIPDFLQRQHGLRLTQIGLPILTIYLIADVGSVAGGWLSSSLLKRGYSVNVARKTTMLICALCVTPIIFAYKMENLWGAVLLIGLAAAAHQGFSANLFTITSDMFPPQAVGSVVGIGGMAGGVGGMLIAKVVGYALQWTGSYMIPFVTAAVAYPIALAIIHALAPKLTPAPIQAET